MATSRNDGSRKETFLMEGPPTVPYAQLLVVGIWYGHAQGGNTRTGVGCDLGGRVWIVWVGVGVVGRGVGMNGYVIGVSDV